MGHIIEATIETLYMTAISVVATFFLGIILGLILFLTSKGKFVGKSSHQWNH